MTKKRRIEEDVTIRDSRTNPDVSIDFVITEIGYQMDLYLDTKERGFTCEKIECRDFGGAPGPKKAIERLLHELQNAVERWRGSL